VRAALMGFLALRKYKHTLVGSSLLSDWDLTVRLTPITLECKNPSRSG